MPTDLRRNLSECISGSSDDLAGAGSKAGATFLVFGSRNTPALALGASNWDDRRTKTNYCRSTTDQNCECSQSLSGLCRISKRGLQFPPRSYRGRILVVFFIG